MCLAGEVGQAYFNTFVPANPNPPSSNPWHLPLGTVPSSGVTILGLMATSATDFGDKLYGWFIPPVTTNYVFFISCDDGGRLSLSTNSSPTNLFVIACESDWSGADEWTNISDTYGQGRAVPIVEMAPPTASLTPTGPMSGITRSRHNRPQPPAIKTAPISLLSPGGTARGNRRSGRTGGCN